MIFADARYVVDLSRYTVTREEMERHMNKDKEPTITIEVPLSVAKSESTPGMSLFSSAKAVRSALKSAVEKHEDKTRSSKLGNWTPAKGSIPEMTARAFVIDGHGGKGLCDPFAVYFPNKETRDLCFAAKEMASVLKEVRRKGYLEKCETDKLDAALRLAGELK